ncbi:hypothetical protein O181_083380 [Austropuccinia psidii MF-1]|uniref:Uncharacterized protein n=1 Tax=Austropuccinia psidii MF-1 TaxID=1389203 RepID=A0A9Q3FTM8_9BASI|nr:hypothetical protein [Austropuccinia psidii MF-1]
MEDGRQGVQPRVTLERSYKKYSEDFPQTDIAKRTYHRIGIEPERAYSDSFRLKRCGQPTKLPNGFTPLRQQKTSGKESPYFPILGNIQDRERNIGKEQAFF